MATRERPGAITHADIFLSMVLDELEDQGKTLAAILDRLPAPDQGADSPAEGGGTVTVHVSEPDTTAPIVAAMKKRTPAKKTTGGKA